MFPAVLVVPLGYAFYLSLFQAALHSIPAVDALRYSITLRTLKGSDGRSSAGRESEFH